MQQFFPHGIGPYLIGGLLIGAAVSFAFAMSGLITGMSTVFSSTWSFFSRLSFFQQQRFLGSRAWRLALAIGLVLGGALFLFTVAHGAAIHTGIPWWRLGGGWNHRRLRRAAQ